MTVNSVIITAGPYSGNDITTEFSYGFRVADKTQLSVYETDDVGVQILLVVDTDYTVAGVGVDAGGLVTRLAGGLPTNYSWYIRSNYVENQLTAFASQGGFLPDVHEAQMDHITFLIQQLRDTTTRSFALSDTIDIDGAFTISDDDAARASKRLGFDASGNLIVVSAVDGTVSVTPFMETLLDDTSAAAGRATLIAAGLTDNNAFTGVNTFSKIQKWAKGADVASVAALTLGDDGNSFDITGATAITSIVTKGVGTVVKLQFDGILTLTNHATDLILPGNANIITAAGDVAELWEYATGDWKCLNYQRAALPPPLSMVTGSWTPTLQDVSRSDAEGQTYSVQVGRYLKVGNFVTFTGQITMTSIGTLSTGSSAIIANLPFVSENVAGLKGVMSTGDVDNFAMPSGSHIAGYIDPNTDEIILEVGDSAAGTTTLSIAEVSANGAISFKGSYTT